MYGCKKRTVKTSPLYKRDIKNAVPGGTTLRQCVRGNNKRGGEGRRRGRGEGGEGRG